MMLLYYNKSMMMSEWSKACDGVYQKQQNGRCCNEQKCGVLVGRHDHCCLIMIVFLTEIKLGRRERKVCFVLLLFLLCVFDVPWFLDDKRLQLYGYPRKMQYQDIFTLPTIFIYLLRVRVHVRVLQEALFLLRVFSFLFSLYHFFFSSFTTKPIQQQQLSSSI